MALWDHVQSTGVDSGSGTSASLSFSTNITAGNILIVIARFGEVSQNPGCSDDKGNTYVRIESVEEPTNTDTLTLWYALAAAAGATQVTITNASSTTRRWIIAEYDAASTTIAADQHTGTIGDSITPDSGNVTTTSASELLVSAGHSSNGRTFTAGTGYTKRQEIATKVALEDKSVSSTGTYSGSWTLSAQDLWAASIVTFSSTAGGGRTTKNTRAFPLGTEIGMNWRGAA